MIDVEFDASPQNKVIDQSSDEVTVYPEVNQGRIT